MHTHKIKKIYSEKLHVVQYIITFSGNDHDYALNSRYILQIISIFILSQKYSIFVTKYK
jgi:hypothetical protein